MCLISKYLEVSAYLSFTDFQFNSIVIRVPAWCVGDCRISETVHICSDLEDPIGQPVVILMIKIYFSEKIQNKISKGKGASEDQVQAFWSIFLVDS